jgi:sRNA-binding carbon storage regulator CsrA
MLVLTRSRDTSALIGDDIVVTVRGFEGDAVLLDVTCPSGLTLRGP